MDSQTIQTIFICEIELQHIHTWITRLLITLCWRFRSKFDVKLLLLWKVMIECVRFWTLVIKQMKKIYISCSNAVKAINYLYFPNYFGQIKFTKNLYQFRFSNRKLKSTLNILLFKWQWWFKDNCLLVLVWVEARIYIHSCLKLRWNQKVLKGLLLNETLKFVFK